jgi:amidase
MQPVMRKLGGRDVNRALDVVLTNTPDLDLVGYMKGLAARAKHVRDWLLFLERYELVVGPVSTEPPFPVGFDIDDQADPRRLLRAQRLLTAVNLLGLPSAAVPVGQLGDKAGAVPLGVQVIGSRYREDLCLDAAEAIEAQCGLPTPIDPAR